MHFPALSRHGWQESMGCPSMLLAATKLFQVLCILKPLRILHQWKSDVKSLHGYRCSQSSAAA